VNANDLREQLTIELDSMQVVVDELQALLHDMTTQKPTLRNVTAAGAFLAQFYNGVENTLKRICVYENVEIPTGDMWHLTLFQYFCSPPYPGLPMLFDNNLARELAPYRRFRHVVLHSYGFQLDWSRLAEGIQGVDGVFNKVTQNIAIYLDSIGNSS
jgi:hypothetical protein